MRPVGRSAGEPASTSRERAHRYADALPHEQRKRRGAWFTPHELATATAARTLAPLLQDRRSTCLRIVDPAVGGGAFLQAALATLVAAGQPASAAISQLYGCDLDDEAVRLAVLALAEACERGDRGDGVAGGGEGGAASTTLKERLATQVRTGDGLRELAAGSFDAVLTNPPWETLQADADAKARVAALRPHFHHQGRGKLYTYRLFVERAFQLLRPGGRLGLVVPASLWFDRDAEPLRRLLLDHCEWQWLYGFENRRRVFAIDSRYRFGVVIATKGGATTSVRVAFHRTELADWAAASPPHVTFTRDELRRLSPASGAFVEVESARDLDVLTRLTRNGVPMLGPDGVFDWRQGDFNMTADRGEFVRREQAEADGYRQGDDGVFRRSGHAELLPLLQGAMLGELHPNAGAHAGGAGHRTTWTTPRALDVLQPQYLVAAAPWRAAADRRHGARLVHRALSNATNGRTMVACLLGDLPVGNSLGILTPRRPSEVPLRFLAAHAACLASLPFDWALRVRLGGTNLNGFVLADCVVPRLDATAEAELARLALRLVAIVPWHADLLARAAAEGWGAGLQPAHDERERAALSTCIDVGVARAFGLQPADVAWITRDCDHAAARLRRRGGAAGLPAKGFWRLDRELPPASRRPLRWLAASGEPAAAPQAAIVTGR